MFGGARSTPAIARIRNLAAPMLLAAAFAYGLSHRGPPDTYDNKLLDGCYSSTAGKAVISGGQMLRLYDGQKYALGPFIENNGNFSVALLSEKGGPLPSSNRGDTHFANVGWGHRPHITLNIVDGNFTPPVFVRGSC